MEDIQEAPEVAGWRLARVDGTQASGSARLKAAESLARFAEAEKFRAAAMLHDEAQRAVDPRLQALENQRGMQLSLRTGRMVSFAATDSAAMEIALVTGLSQGQAHRVLEQAETLVMDTPEVLESMALGRIGASHVQRILEHVHHIVPELLAPPRHGADEATKEQWERDVAARAAKARADRRDFGVDMLAVAPGKCPSQVRCRGRQVLEKYYGLSFTTRSRTALRDRRITLEEAADGMTWLSGFLPTASCQAIFSKVDAMARLLKLDPDAAAEVDHAAHTAAAPGAGAAAGAAREPAQDPHEDRTMDQLRADVFADMLLNGPRGQGLEAVNAEVFVAIPATMFPGIPGGPPAAEAVPDGGDGPARDNQLPRPAAPATGGPTSCRPVPRDAAGDLAAAHPGRAQLPAGAPVPTVLGGGPIDQESAARLMIAAKTWWRLITDPVTGAIVSFGRDRYRPSAAQRAALRFRDGGCTTPGCTGAARNCDIDHTSEWQDGGGTDLANLHLGCKRCHRLKSLGLIEVEQRAGGTTVVTSLFGTRRVSYPAAPWAVADPRRAASGDGQDPGGPPPPDPEALIPPIPERPKLSAKDPDTTNISARGDTGQAASPAEGRATGDAAGPGTRKDGSDEPTGDAGQQTARAGEACPADGADQDRVAEAKRYQQMQNEEWGRIQDVPDSSSENPEHGRYARTNHARGTRKRRLKRNAGGYGPPAIHRPDDRDNPLRPPPGPPPDPGADPPY